MLKRQHREIEVLFAEAGKAIDFDDRRLIVEQIEKKLRAHLMVKEHIFYPAVLAVTGMGRARDLIPEAYAEHPVLNLVLGELPALDAQDETFEAKITALFSLVALRVEEEERELLPAAEQMLGSDVLAALATQMQAAIDGRTAAIAR